MGMKQWQNNRSKTMADQLVLKKVVKTMAEQWVQNNGITMGLKKWVKTMAEQWDQNSAKTMGPKIGLKYWVQNNGFKQWQNSGS